MFIFKLPAKLLAYARTKGYNTVWLLNGKMQCAFITKDR